jgi:hypothetical protein
MDKDQYMIEASENTAFVEMEIARPLTYATASVGTKVVGALSTFYFTFRATAPLMAGDVVVLVAPDEIETYLSSSVNSCGGLQGLSE